MAAFDPLLHGAPLAFAAFAWWFSTGAILWLDGRGRDTYSWSFGLAGGVGLGALALVLATKGEASVWGAYAGFTGALGLWAWHEMSFLMGFITGPRREPCPPALAGWARFRAASATLIHHEIALALTLAAVFALTWGAPNMMAAWTFALMWALRLSTKLNLFVGAPHFTDAFLPSHLSHLPSYMTRRPAGAFFWCAFGAVGGLTAFLAGQALQSGQTAAAATGYSLLFALSLLGLAEHLFLALPLREAALWRWALAGRAAPEAKDNAGSARRAPPQPLRAKDE
jgi:putative photosynthetic complex assembly protein 2